QAMSVEPQPSAGPQPSARPGCNCADPDSAAGSAAFLGWVGQLVHRHRRELAAVARAEGLGAEDAFDAVQDAFQTFLTLPAAHPLVDAADDSRRLLITLTRTVARNRRRLHARARPHVGDPGVVAALPAAGASADDLIAAAEDRVRLHRCVQ